MAKKVNNYLLFIEYNGKYFCGWQFQPSHRTVQAEIEKALRNIFHTKIPLTGSGRTDAGVHANLQTATFSTKTTLKPYKLRAALNHHLPKDIAIHDVKLVKNGFSARFDAKERIYEYIIWNKPYRSVLQNGLSWQLYSKLDTKKMAKAAGYLVGKHDFTSFTNLGSDTIDNIVNLKSIKLRRSKGNIYITFKADRFLNHMVRNIVGFLAEVGRGRRSPESTKSVLSGKDRSLAGLSAPPQGLYFKKVVYK